MKKSITLFAFITSFVFAISHSVSYGQCTNSIGFGLGTLTNTVGSSDTIFCHYATEYGLWEGVAAGYSYTTTSEIATDYITVRTGSSSGPVVAFGVQPLTWTATTSGTYYIHINTNASCGTETNCRDVATTNNGPASACTNPANAGSVESSIDLACAGSPFSLYLTGASVGTGLTYQWQSSANGVSYSDIPGATSPSYSATQSALTYYVCIVTCASGTPVPSAPLMVDMGTCVIMTNGSATTCGGIFYDSGGSSGNYSNNENYTFTITPSTVGSFLHVEFNSYTSEFSDEMTVYDGNSTAATQLGTFNSNPGGITSSAADGSLTFEFNSDFSVTYGGWEGVLSCVTTGPSNDNVCSPIAIPVNGSVNTYTNTLATVETDEITIAPPSTGNYETTGWGISTLEHTVWFTFVAPTSGNVTISGTDSPMNGQAAVYSVGNCADFTTFDFIAGNDDALDYSSDAPEFTVCGLTPGQTYYLLYDSGNTLASGNFTLSITGLNLSAGSSLNVVNVCGGESVDLFDGITGYDTGGTWEETIPTFGVFGSTWNTSGVAFQVFDFLYIVEEGCLSDTATASIHVFGPSSAGTDGTLNVCRLETINLLSGLSGNVDLGGTWYNPSNQPLVGNVITTSNIPGQFNYDYVADNGVCPQDTSNVLVIVSDCLAGLNELTSTSVAVHPNPSNGSFIVTFSHETSGLNAKIVDMNGREVPASINWSNNAASVDMLSAEKGVYFLQLAGDIERLTLKVVVEK
jgi:hypothetical protein